MSVHNNGNAPASPMSDALSRAGVTAPQAPAAPQPSVRAPRQARGDLNSLLRRPMSRKQTGEAVLGYVDALKGYLEKSVGPAYNENFKLHVLDSGTHLLPLSTILVSFAAADKTGTKVDTAVYLLVVEASGGKLSPRTFNINGKQVEVPTVAGDVIDEVLVKKALSFVADATGAKIEDVLYAGATVLPAELAAADKDRIYNVAYFVTSALYTVLEKSTLSQEAPLSVSMIDNGTNLSAALDYNPARVETAVGLPVHSTLSIALRSTINAGGSFNIEQVRELTRVDGYVEPIFTPAQPIQQVYGQPQQPLTRNYTPRYVITRLDSQVDATTLELTLLTLSTATLASRDFTWGGVFQPRYLTGPAAGEPDLRDIGAIGYEVALDPTVGPKPIKTKSDTFTKADLFRLLNDTFHNNLVYSLDVEEAGELSWNEQIFIAAANGDRRANDDIVAAANSLTDGRFGGLWEQGRALVNDDRNRIFLGYWTDKSGERRDLREIDYLAVLNLVGEDLSVLQKYEATFNDTSRPIEERLETRQQILTNLVPSAVIKGYARRITFAPDFLVALTTAVAQAGLQIRPQNLFVVEGQGGRSLYNAGAFGLNPSALSDRLFSYGAQSGVQSYHGIGNAFGRY